MALVAFGALIGFVPSLVLLVVQVTVEHDRFTTQQRMTVANECKGVLQESANLLREIEAIQMSAETAYQKPVVRMEDMTRTTEQMRLVTIRMYSWQATLNGQAIVMSAVLEQHLPLPPWAEVLPKWAEPTIETTKPTYETELLAQGKLEK